MPEAVWGYAYSICVCAQGSADNIHVAVCVSGAVCRVCVHAWGHMLGMGVWCVYMYVTVWDMYVSMGLCMCGIVCVVCMCV